MNHSIQTYHDNNNCGVYACQFIIKYMALDADLFFDNSEKNLLALRKSMKAALIKQLEK